MEHSFVSLRTRRVCVNKNEHGKRIWRPFDRHFEWAPIDIFIRCFLADDNTRLSGGVSISSFEKRILSGRHLITSCTCAATWIPLPATMEVRLHHEERSPPRRLL